MLTVKPIINFTLYAYNDNISALIATAKRTLEQTT